VAQPGDPYAAQRARPRAELFRDDGQLNEYARRAHFRAQADLMYLSLWRLHGAAEAGRMTCEQFGHDPRGRQCERCGALVR
jgi:hypothetical protein